MTSTDRMSAPAVAEGRRHRAQRARPVGQHQAQQMGHATTLSYSDVDHVKRRSEIADSSSVGLIRATADGGAS